jgi:hypothetical protein
MAKELERYGRPYFLCDDCEYGSFDRTMTEAHARDHVPPKSLDDLLAERSAPPEAPVAASTSTRRRR